MRIMITGGGTGGHTSPAVAVIEELHKRDPQLSIQWVGRRNGIEQRICRNLSIPFRSLPVEGWPRRSSVRRLWVAGKLALGMARAWMLIRKFGPQIVLGVGGYVSLPLVYAAQRMGLPTILHEQNRLFGMANRVLAPRATRILLSFPDTQGDFDRDKAVLVGNPVRAGFLSPPSQAEARKLFGLDEPAEDAGLSPPVILVVGGSQGAHQLNRAMADALPHFRADEVEFLWMTGNTDAVTARQAAARASVRANVFTFIDDMVSACAAADLIVSRSGASSTAEIAAMGKPSVLVPYPHATDNHQEQNARAFEERGAAIVLLDHDCTGERLLEVLRALLNDAERRTSMARAAASLARPGAAERIVEEILSLVFSSSREY